MSARYDVVAGDTRSCDLAFPAADVGGLRGAKVLRETVGVVLAEQGRAVEVDALPRDERSLVRCQEGKEVGGVGGDTRAADASRFVAFSWLAR